jgi:hypothetical protein
MNADEIKDWLDSIGKDRHWLAEKCGVKKNTVDGWLSNGRPISGPALLVLKELMNPGRPLTPALDYTTWKRLEAKAAMRRISLEQLIAEILTHEAAVSDEETKARYGLTQ